ncbi:endonuclease/exonuclease/phosphatase family protein [candidate division KSB1 bacterium]|nr:endonuclease/exonuclease/phosphatase family protein [candidate division KSB1 bacterium]
MPTIFDPPPQNIRLEIERLNTALDSTIPRKTDHNLLIASWNLRAFASLTRQWTAAATDSPKRDLRGLLAIIHILSRFDVIAIQEVKGDLRALRDTIHYLGDRWAFLMTDVNRGAAGNSERMAFIFDTQRLKLSGLACELVIPKEWLDEISPDALKQQFVRSPYAVSFRTGDTTFILVTLHVDYGDASHDRIPELRAIARWMHDWASRSNAWHHNLLALGDFNIDRRDSPLWAAFTSTGLTVPQALNGAPRTIFADPQDPQKDNFYDQIAWFAEGSIQLIGMTCTNGGIFDFLPHVYLDLGLTKLSTSYRISDHYPLWIEFQI